MELLASNTRILPSTQAKLVKALLSGAYDGITTDLGLKQQQNEKTKQVTNALRTHILGAVSEYQNQNKNAAPGSLKNIVAAAQNLLTSMEPLVKDGGLLTPKGIKVLKGSGGGVNKAVVKKKDKEIKQLTSENAKASHKVTALEAELKSANEQIQLLSQKQMEMAGSVVKHEEGTASLEKKIKQLENKTKMCEVFEQGLKDLKTMLEGEAAEKNKLQEQYEHLSRVQSKYKIAWVPNSASDHCLSCSSKFAMFGSKSKHHCRYCGRLFCGSCCSKFTPIPELGFPSKVRVCTRCFDLRTGGGHEDGGGGGGIHDSLDDDEDDFLDSD